MSSSVSFGRAPLVFLVLLVATVYQAGAATLVVSNTGDSGAGSLRQAIADANASPGLDTIVFQIPGIGPFTITPSSALPAITDSVIIDGTTQTGFAGTPIIELDGTAAGNNGGLRLLSGTNTVRGLCINRFAGGGVRLEGFGGNAIQGNVIGTDPTGTIARGNGQNGVLINNSPGNLIGGTNSGDGNLISANADTGVYLLATSSNVVMGNYIGTTAAGILPLGNLNNGIALYGSSGNVIGGTTVSARNVVSGNQGSGIYLFGDTASWNVIQGNFIGTSASGGAAVSNAADGITLSGSASNTIGGAVSGAGNLISGNGKAGVSMTDVRLGGNVVAGNSIGASVSGFTAIGNLYAGVTLLNSTNNTVGGVTAAARNLISGNRQDGIFMTNSGLNVVQGNWIGISGSGSGSLQNFFNGISISGAGSNMIGGTVAGAGNLISGNANYGIEIFSGSSSNIVLGNFIGQNASGNLPVRNLLCGIRIESPANFIGGPTSGARNVISGNAQDGIMLAGASASNNVIQGNYIGTTAAGTGAFHNGRAGVGISGAPGNVVGGVGAGEGNLISGNSDAGVYMIGATAIGNTILGNRLGTDVDGVSSIGNSYEGVYLENARSNTVGGAVSGAGNLIAGNFTRGVFMTNAAWNLIQGNFIGTKADGVSGLGNTYHGVECESNACNNIIGGPGSAGNRIAFAQNVYAGVRVRDGATNNLIRGNSIFSNGALGIDLSGGGSFMFAGVTANDPCDTDTGGNNLQNFPVITRAYAGNETLVRGTLNAAASTTYIVQFFGSPACDSSGYGEGQLFLGEATITTSNNCNGGFVVALSTPLQPGYVVTATAADPANNTSEFSACVTADPIPTLSISQTPDNQVSLSWPTPASGFVLKETTSLAPPIHWTIVNPAATLKTGQMVVTRPLDDIQRFYYLAWE